MPRTGLEAWLGAAAVHERVISIAASQWREASRREHVRGVQEGAAEAIADQVLRVQRIVAPVLCIRLRFLRTVETQGRPCLDHRELQTQLQAQSDKPTPVRPPLDLQFYCASHYAAPCRDVEKTAFGSYACLSIEV
jgi:hypothetical protein